MSFRRGVRVAGAQGRLGSRLIRVPAAEHLIPRDDGGYGCHEVVTVSGGEFTRRIWRHIQRDADDTGTEYDITIDGLTAAASDGLGDDPRWLRQLADVVTRGRRAGRATRHRCSPTPSRQDAGGREVSAHARSTTNIIGIVLVVTGVMAFYVVGNPALLLVVAGVALCVTAAVMEGRRSSSDGIPGGERHRPQP